MPTAPCVVAVMALALAIGAQAPAARSQTDSGISSSGAISEKPDLTASQRQAIYAAVSRDKSRTAPQHFPTVIGGDVPPMIELYALPDDVVADNPAAKMYKYTVVQDQVVLVDPTKMRVVDVIGPRPQ